MKINRIIAITPRAALCIVITTATVCAQGEKPHPATELVGLWKAERTFGPEVQGQLTIFKRSDGWTAEVAGHTIPFLVQGNAVVFAVPGERGSFTGALNAQGDSISGHWIQPPTVSNRVRFASPVYLLRDRPNVWTGTVAPLEDRMTFYLPIHRNPDGTVTGFLRNPETNFGRFFHIEQVLMDGDQVRYLEPGIDGTRLPCTYYPELDMFSIYMPDAGGSFDFRRVTNDSASLFYPRPKTDPPYSYHPPRPGDGWEVASLNDVGMAVGPIEDLVRAIINTPMDSVNSPYIHALLIARHGKLVVEEYFHGYTADMPHETRSASKSVTSTLIGLAIQNGEPISVETPVYDLMYDGNPPADLDPRAQRIKLKHLLTMAPGFACDDNDPDSPGQEDRMQGQQEEPDWVQYTLDLPMSYEPGEHAAYCSASLNLAAALLHKATNTWLPKLYRKNFAEPMGMGLYHMNLMPTGEAYGGGGLYIKARDFLKMGQIFLDGGYWKKKRLLSDAWVHDAITPVTHMFDQGYGYAWWILDYPIDQDTVRAFYAGGNGGQYVIGVPELDLAVVFFGGNYGQRILHMPKLIYVPQYIIKSARQVSH